MEYGKSCCFTGHRPSKLPWKYNEADPRCIAFKEKLSAVTEAVYESGISHFITGMAAGCDMYCAEAVIALRRRHPDITLEAAVPYDGQEARWNSALQERYRRILCECNTVTLLRDSYSPDCMMKRNRYMVDHSSVLIACYGGESGGTRNTIKYATDKDKEIIQLSVL
ncbi:MAG: DUF1273 family protein [Oscillospiraceae bacterium]|nr:DUF1273 family protein [Oscillospiraceae bacterium]